MAGIYLHIPFCKKACHYCNFHFSTNLSTVERMTAALQQELITRRSYLVDHVSTIYFGGGTPSLLPYQSIAEIINTIQNNYTLERTVDISFEVNPDDITPNSLQDWKKAGVNRLSVGIQSFFEDELIWMNRAHNAQQALDCLQAIPRAGFSNYSIDLIYGGPRLTQHKWARNLDIAFEAGVPHLSCYALTVEPRTPLYQAILKQKQADVDSEEQASQFLFLVEQARKFGYDHYEISNFSKPGMRSKHNSSYWQGKHYLGIGPSAHSFNGVSRQWNVSNNALYLAGIEANQSFWEIETLTITQQINEYIMTSVRTMEGVDLRYIETLANSETSKQLLSEAQLFIDQGKMQVKENQLVLTDLGKLFADGIASSLFLED